MITTSGAIPTIEPSTAEDLAATLRRASDERQSIVIRGAGTKMDWGRPPQRVDAIVSTRRLNRVLAHQHGDLTATIEAGATLHEVNEALGGHGQWLPLDPPFADRATIGGLLATNDSGPLRHRFGTPRDLVIGVQLATTDGALAKAGGQVVKNVAGYDLSKLVCGSFGSLAAIVSATFKLAPRPSASKTIVIEVPDVEALAQIIREVMASQLEPIAFEIEISTVAQGFSPASLLLRFASVPAAVDDQIGQLRSLAGLKPCAPSVLSGQAEDSAWGQHSLRFRDAPGAIVRASWLPADIASAMAALNRALSEGGCAAHETAMIGRAAIGSGLIRIGGDAHAQAGAIEALRRSSSFRNVVIVRGGDELKSLVDVWGVQPDRGRLFASLKRTLDPYDTLNAGRGPL